MMVYPGTLGRNLLSHFLNILKFYVFIYLFLERGEGREQRRRETSMCGWLPLACHQLGTWPATQACALTGNQTSDPLVHRLALNPLSHTSPGQIIKILKKKKVTTTNEVQ